MGIEHYYWKRIIWEYCTFIGCLMFLDRIVIYLQWMHSKSFLLFWHIPYAIIYTLPLIHHSVVFFSQTYYSSLEQPLFHQFAFPHLLTQASGHTLYNRPLYFFSISTYIPHWHEINLFILHMNFLNENMSQVIIPFQILQVVNSLWCVFCHLLTNRLID